MAELSDLDIIMDAAKWAQKYYPSSREEIEAAGEILLRTMRAPRTIVVSTPLGDEEPFWYQQTVTQRVRAFPFGTEDLLVPMASWWIPEDLRTQMKELDDGSRTQNLWAKLWDR